MSNIIINRPMAMYANGELIGIITNPDPIVDFEELLENSNLKLQAVTIPTHGMESNWDTLKTTLESLNVESTVTFESDDEV